MTCSDREVAAQLAAYDVVSLAVVDETGRLVGAITIDDVLDRVLPTRLAPGAVGARLMRELERARLMARGDDLSKPKGAAGAGPVYDPDEFGRLAERLARFFGTPRYIIGQTIIVIIWIILNVAVVVLRFDPYPFILLNLAFSTQAAYAAPLILLAQNRQADRDKEETERDREMNARVAGRDRVSGA